MKKTYSFILLFFLSWSVNAQIINFTDANLKAKLVAASPSNYIAKGIDFGSYITIDTNNDGEIQVAEAELVYWLDLDNTPAGNNDITNVIGLDFFTNLQTLSCTYNSITNFTLANLGNLEYLYCGNNTITTLILSNLNSLTHLQCQNNNLAALDISGYPNLIEINCSSNNNLTSVSLSNLPNFKKLFAIYSQISTLNLSNLPMLEDLDVTSNLLTNLNVSSFTTLKDLKCSINSISSLNVSTLTSLLSLTCANNQLTQLDVSNLTNLTTLNCGGNQITTLDVSNSTNMNYLVCAGNQLTSLDVSNLPLLTFFYCHTNLLSELYLKNGVNYTLQMSNENIGNGYKLFSNPNLVYVCVDDAKVTSIQNYFTNLPNLVVNSYCSFVPGGTLYEVQGNVTYDQNQNGCDATDVLLPNLNVSIFNGTNYTGFINSNASGSYSVSLNAGSYTITPILENTNYFNVSPSSFTANFPTNASPFIQNFCLTSNGTHNDLEVWVFPLGIARPGFTSTYKVVYKNKGTQSQSGTVNLTFDDAIMNLVVSNPLITNQTTNNLNWTFSNLQPFETRQILIDFDLNSPVDTPALNSGDSLSYSAVISGATDETPLDNTATLLHSVVNSFDPNDKICLEGTAIQPTSVGEYVHYRIRFENTGTANAQNIVVKDLIDTAKFDVSTLVPIDGSHDFVTRISNTNQVEFIFENIQLPFDDANNDGYVVFKIKTNPNLVLGDTFSNTASIYFDYNFPIVTTTYTTTIAALAAVGFEFSNYFELAPNPTQNLLYIRSKNQIELSSISIYNTLGQLVLVIPNAKETSSIDVSHLTSGTYYIQVVSDQGSSNSKFIKD